MQVVANRIFLCNTTRYLFSNYHIILNMLWRFQKGNALSILIKPLFNLFFEVISGKSHIYRKIKP